MKIAAIGNWKKFSERGNHKEIGLIRQKIMEMPEMRGIMLVQTKYNLKTYEPISTAIYGLYRYVPLWRVWFSSSLLWDRVYKSESLGLE